MKLLLVALFIWFFSIPVLFFARKNGRLCSVIGALSAVAGSIFAIVACLKILVSNSYEKIYIDWNFVLEKMALSIDPVSAWFIIPICGLSSLAAIYAVAYEWESETGFSKSLSWSFFLLLLFSMVLVVMAGNGIVFLIGWEAMAIASFFLVIRDQLKSSDQQDAGWIY
ncbi:MAG: hypothetical protein ACPMAG_02655, partial [Limisphaerales bacterium]